MQQFYDVWVSLSSYYLLTKFNKVSFRFFLFFFLLRLKYCFRNLANTEFMKIFSCCFEALLFYFSHLYLYSFEFFTWYRKRLLLFYKCKYPIDSGQLNEKIISAYTLGHIVFINCMTINMWIYFWIFCSGPFVTFLCLHSSHSLLYFHASIFISFSYFLKNFVQLFFFFLSLCWCKLIFSFSAVLLEKY